MFSIETLMKGVKPVTDEEKNLEWFDSLGFNAFFGLFCLSRFLYMEKNPVRFNHQGRHKLLLLGIEKKHVFLTDGIVLENQHKSDSRALFRSVGLSYFFEKLIAKDYLLEQSSVVVKIAIKIFMIESKPVITEHYEIE